ncbi:MAG: gamma-glutamyltransferase family protein [Rhodobacteraceae bacterium]|jgi:gamma-glutamyltranspeptidase/glutathione hydrolase|uniref:gamma-glutamyltransferase family protein n=1 Tax=Albidovulum sp. TaxID=1872424 RepID=UPI001D865DDA|nr:gamma-glutamyltransferase family protein [uncultured Defluviimonas sp.]MCB2124649.1 gamma-glutamyltransferase family protein [Paracoccaceae bacterium]MCC0071153.1 gamma-glutamyltransferase family protein [Paracoccaceae bacterium]
MRDFQRPGRSPVFATNAMCATSHPLAAKVALDILQAGGNAADAAIAGAVLLGIAEPQSCGIGGDCFVLLKPAGSEEVVALNGSGRAPAGLAAADLRARGMAAIGTETVESVTVPGAVDAFCALSDRYGRLGLGAALAPAIRYAEEGVPVAPRVAFDWADDGPRLSGAARGFYLKDGRPLTTGEIFRAPGQAEVLRRIVHQGRDGFYAGEVAEDMVRSLTAAGGTHTLGDFAATACVWGDPIAGRYRDHDLMEHPPNGQGATAILLLKILGHFDIAGLDPLGPERAHLEAEAAKLAYDARDRFIADPAHTSRLSHMLSDDTAARLAALIDPRRAMAQVARRTEAIHRDTVYLTVVDRDRMAVSMIYSTYWGFGSGIASEKFGILFQNRGAGFTLAEGHPNEAAGGRRPMHTIIPGMLAHGGKVVMPFGVMGGSFQPMGHAHVTSNLLDFGMDPQEALDSPRAMAEAGVLKVERGYPEATRARLAAMGHDVVAPDGPLGGGQAIRIDAARGILIGASDPRKDGCALGY